MKRQAVAKLFNQNYKYHEYSKFDLGSKPVTY